MWSAFGSTGTSGILDIEAGTRYVFYSRLPGILEDHGVSVERMTSPDDNLQSVFQ